jgi:hypothetical protein
MTCRGVCLLAAALLAAGGCASTVPYGGGHPDNLTFSVEGSRGSFLTSAEVSLNVFFADAPCERQYRGSVSLSPGDSPKQIGLPTDRDVYIRIFTESHSWLANRTKTRSHEFRFRPRPGHTYTVQYTHQKKAYGLQLTGTNLSTRQTSRLRQQDWGAC